MSGHTATSKSDVASEIAWLIEMTEEERAGRPPIYWGHVEEGEGWTRDIKEAFRFKASHDAEMRASDCGIPDYEVIEHAWVVPTRHPIETLWRKVGLPEYFLGNDGSNVRLYALYGAIVTNSHADLVRALEEIRGGHFRGAGTLAVNGDWKAIVENLQEIARAALATLTARKVG